METKDITAALRRITASVIAGDRLEILHRIEALSDALIDHSPEAYEVPEVVGYDTILGYLNKYQPLALAEMMDPMFETIGHGQVLSKLCRKAGKQPIKVASPKVVSDQFRKASHVNMYPLEMLRKYFDQSPV